MAVGGCGREQKMKRSAATSLGAMPRLGIGGAPRIRARGARPRVSRTTSESAPSMFARSRDPPSVLVVGSACATLEPARGRARSTGARRRRPRHPAQLVHLIPRLNSPPPAASARNGLACASLAVQVAGDSSSLGLQLHSSPRGPRAILAPIPRPDGPCPWAATNRRSGRWTTASRLPPSRSRTTSPPAARMVGGNWLPPPCSHSRQPKPSLADQRSANKMMNNSSHSLALFLPPRGRSRRSPSATIGALVLIGNLGLLLASGVEGRRGRAL